MIARITLSRLPPKTVTPSTPTKTVANSMLGETQVQKRSRGDPCRSASGMYSTPPGSTAITRSP